MTIKEAGQIEIEKRSFYIIPPEILEICNVCKQTDELRCGVCFGCQSLCETDMKEVWERDKPEHRWPYLWSTGWNVAKALMQ